MPFKFYAEEAKKVKQALEEAQATIASLRTLKRYATFAAERRTDGRIYAYAELEEHADGNFVKWEDLAAALAEGTAVPDPPGACQHQLAKQSDRCKHGYAFGTTCDKCILACPLCWDIYSSSGSFGPRPAVTGAQK